MNCESARKDFSLFLYGELSLEQEQLIQDHVDGCTTCQKELDKEKALHRLLDGRERVASPALLARCRRDLTTQLAAGAPGRPGWPAWLRTLFAGHFGSWQSLRRPAGALALVALGFVIARATAPDRALVPYPQSLAQTDETAVISRVRNVQPDESGRVHITLDETRQRVITGRPDEEQIRRVLLTVARESSDPGLRGESMEILKSRPELQEVRRALLQAVEHDPNPGVRLKALEGLKAYAGEPEVRRTLSYILLNDENPGLRTQAVDLLTEQNEESMVGMLQEVVQKEDNRYVRLRCQRALEEMKASVGTF